MCRCDRPTPPSPLYGSLPGLLEPDCSATRRTLTLLYGCSLLPASSSLLSGQSELPQLICWPTAATAVVHQLQHGLQVTTPAWEHQCEEGFEALMARLVWRQHADSSRVPSSLQAKTPFQIFTGLYTHTYRCCISSFKTSKTVSAHGEKETCVFQSHLFPGS